MMMMQPMLFVSVLLVALVAFASGTSSYSSAGGLPSRCYLPVKPGPCYAYKPRWYYSPQYNKCIKFVYGGCQGNSNRFSSEYSCERYCRASGHGGGPYQDDPNPFGHGGGGGGGGGYGQSSPTTYNDICYLPKDSGDCYDHYQKWFYNNYTKKCEQFTYSGCGGNANNFNDRYECNNKCGSRYPSTGYRGTGNRGSGYRGSGYRGSGYRGSGYRGSGHRGSGYRGTGYRGTSSGHH